MRLAILDQGHSFGTKALFAMIRMASRQPTPEPLKLVSYRADFLGDHLKQITHEAMRGPSPWTVAERELMAAHVSSLNACRYCVSAHCAVASAAYGDGRDVAKMLADLDAAPISPALRATLRLLGKLARERSVDAADMRATLAAGATPEQIRDALAVLYTFGVTNRLADTFGFAVPDPSVFAAGAKYLLNHGYK